MKNIRFDGLEDQAYAQIVAAFAQTYHYQAKVQNDRGELIDNTQSAEDFFLMKVMDHIYDVTSSVQVTNATNNFRTRVSARVATANQTARQSIEVQVVDGKAK